MIFRAALTPAGRQFIKQLYMAGPPSLENTNKIAALAQFLRASDEATGLSERP